WSVEWVDAVIHIQAPKLAEFTDQIAQNLNWVLAGSGPGSRPRVNVKVKSGELTGIVGNSEAFQCFATVTLRHEWPEGRQAGDE
ncbi:MAG: 2-C-methyl-D-erythritol 2,4-cyclodiphosphate synthase, partial [Synergistota bacterium]|nr:2-C-methyl-D-erythritol 2,4-cyclodiphosphate synthase [Synergistota bacterium]